MGQYKDKVERQRLLLEAEKWAEGVKDIHVHSMNSMWYDDKPEDTANNKNVTDTTYNSGLIKREQDGKVLRYFGEQLTGDALIDDYVRKVAPSVTQSILM
jgi:hypothetical protein